MFSIMEKVHVKAQDASASARTTRHHLDKIALESYGFSGKLVQMGTGIVR